MEASWHCLTDPAVKDGTCVLDVSLMDTSWSSNRQLNKFIWQDIKLHTLTWITQSCKKYNKMRNQFLTDKIPSLFLAHYWRNWIKENLAEKFSRLQSTQDSCLLKTPVHFWKKFGNIEFQKSFFLFKWKYLCDFYTKIILMCLICGGYYKTTYHVKSINICYIYMCNQHCHISKLTNIYLINMVRPEEHSL